MAKDKYKYYGLHLGQFRKEHGRTKTYLLILVITILLCGLLYGCYLLDMQH